MLQPYRDKPVEAVPSKIGGQDVRHTLISFDDIEATITWHDPSLTNGSQYRKATKTYVGDEEPTPDYPGGVCVQQFRNTPMLESGDSRLVEDLKYSAMTGFMQVDQDTIIPWHRIIEIAVTKRTNRSFTIHWVCYSYGQ